MSVELTFELRLESDYHIGAGYALGGVDSALKRDVDGCPMIEGTTLHGLLADGMYELLRSSLFARLRLCRQSGNPDTEDEYCGQHGPAQGTCPVCYILGSPAHAKRWTLSKARPVGLSALLKDRWSAAQQTSHAAAHVRIDPRTRRAEEAKLFLREEGDGRLAFRFAAAFDAPGAPTVAEVGMLVAAARRVRHLGASRRRGRGRCVISLVAQKGLSELPPEGESLQTAILDRFKSDWLAGLPEGWQRRPALSRGTERRLQAPLDEHTYRLAVTVYLREPLLIAQHALAGNQFEARPLIPGSALRGALARRVAQRYELEPGQGAYDDFVSLFFRDAVRFPTLLPARISGNGLLPAIMAPRDLVTCSIYPDFAAGEGHGHWFLTREGPTECVTCGQPPHGARVKLAAVEDFLPLQSRPEAFRPLAQVEMHPSIDRESKRVRREGGLYSYLALEAGQYFVGEMTCANEDAWRALCEMAGLPGEGEPVPLRLGRARGRGHGQALVHFRPLAKTALSPWVAKPLGARVPLTDGRLAGPLVMTLLTDTILTDAWGRCQTGFSPEVLRQELGLPGLEVGQAFCATRPVDGFNDYLGLPRSRDLALAAGSSVSLRLASTPADLLTLLEKVEREGIGLRRNEGFGVVAFNHPVYQDWQGLVENRIPLPVSLQLAAQPAEGLYGPQARFLSGWQRKLEGKPGRDCQSPPFAAVARWLHSLAGLPTAEIRQRLLQLGRPEQLVEVPLPGRTKPNYFEEEGKAGLEQVARLLEACEQDLREVYRSQEPPAQVRHEAIRLLAEWVAAQAALAEEKGGQR